MPHFSFMITSDKRRVIIGASCRTLCALRDSNSRPNEYESFALTN